MKKILLLLAVLAAFAPTVSAQRIKETHRFAIKGADTLFVDRHIDPSKLKGDHVISYKPFSGYNTHEIQAFVEKFVLQGLKLEMRTEEYNLVESSHLPGIKPVHSQNPNAEGMPNPIPPAQR